MSRRDINRPMAAALTMMAAMFVVGFIDNYISRIAQSLGVWQFQMMRACLALPLVFCLSLLGFGTFWPKRWPTIMARSMCIAIAISFYFASLSFMPIAQAVAGFFTSPLFVLLINVFVMRQRVGVWRVGAVLIGFVGIILVLQPGGGQFDLLLLMPVAGGLFNAIGMVATRSWCEDESAVSLLAGFLLMQGIMGGVALAVLSYVAPDVPAGVDGYLLRGWVWDVMPVILPVLLQVVGVVVGVGLVFRAYQMEEPSFVAVFEYSIMVFAPFFAWVLFGQGLGIGQALGIAMIIGAGVIIALRSEPSDAASQEHDAPVI